MMSHKKFGPDRFSRFDVYWIQTNRQAKFIYRCQNKNDGDVLDFNLKVYDFQLHLLDFNSKLSYGFMQHREGEKLTELFTLQFRKMISYLFLLR